MDALFFFSYFFLFPRLRFLFSRRDLDTTAVAGLQKKTFPRSLSLCFFLWVGGEKRRPHVCTGASQRQMKIHIAPSLPESFRPHEDQVWKIRRRLAVGGDHILCEGGARGDGGGFRVRFKKRRLTVRDLMFMWVTGKVFDAKAYRAKRTCRTRDCVRPAHHCLVERGITKIRLSERRRRPSKR